jgi:hypothetical protein
MLMILQTAALVIIIGGTSWLLFVSFLMFVQPMQFLAMLRMTATTRAINNWEQGFRLLSGIAFYVRAEVSKSPLIFHWIALVLIVSAALLLLLPLGWHSAYARWWSRKLSPAAVRHLAPVSAIAGIALTYAAF